MFLVILDHASDAGFLPPALSFNRAGTCGVLLFFALSAFLLTYLLLAGNNPELGSRSTWANYWLRRFLRIYPLFALSLVAWSFKHRSFGWVDVGNHLLLRDGQRHFWTIPVEFKFYFILPLLVVIPTVLWRKHRWYAIGAGTALAAFLRLGLRPVEAAWSLTNDVWLSSYLQVFLLGAIAGVVFAKLGQQVRAIAADNRTLRWLMEICAWLCLVCALLRVPAIYNQVFTPAVSVERFHNTIGLFAMVWPFFLLTMLLGAGWLRRLLSTLPLRALGWISYSLYLWHPFFIDWVKELAVPPIAHFPIFVGLSVLAAGISYLAIERPLARIRLGAVRRDLSAPAAPVAPLASIAP